ncbi:unnamed protein product [Nesidiocoris tenuis]|uniref:Uncharacterized protein n=1 Tax=Nesidiocoris tenuis TaxID=355587 RepID=A0A6H5H4J6_9HEMI|nr:unnamed protein product [Nesidiocoris tenuis]
MRYFEAQSINWLIREINQAQVTHSHGQSSINYRSIAVRVSHCGSNKNAYTDAGSCRSPSTSSRIKDIFQSSGSLPGSGLAPTAIVAFYIIFMPQPRTSLHDSTENQRIHSNESKSILVGLIQWVIRSEIKWNMDFFNPPNRLEIWKLTTERVEARLTARLPRAARPSQFVVTGSADGSTTRARPPRLARHVIVILGRSRKNQKLLGLVSAARPDSANRRRKTKSEERACSFMSVHTRQIFACACSASASRRSVFRHLPSASVVSRLHRLCNRLCLIICVLLEKSVVELWKTPVLLEVQHHGVHRMQPEDIGQQGATWLNIILEILHLIRRILKLIWKIKSSICLGKFSIRLGNSIPTL